MPPRFTLLTLLALSLGLLAGPALRAYDPAAPSPRPFHFSRDTFSFANETVWNYTDGTVHADAAAKKRDYTRRCFVVTRAALQFFKFARFDPDAKKLPDAQLAERIRAVTERSVWLAPLPHSERIVIPGYASLRAASAKKGPLFQANIGLGWPIYLRPGNAPIAVPVTSSTETRLSGEILQDLKVNQPTILWLYLFPSLKINHVVVVFAAHREHGIVAYSVYDPNYAGDSKTLLYDAETGSFSYQPTFYFKGGPVTARAVYRGLFQ